MDNEKLGMFDQNSYPEEWPSDADAPAVTNEVSAPTQNNNASVVPAAVFSHLLNEHQELKKQYDIVSTRLKEANVELSSKREYSTLKDMAFYIPFISSALMLFFLLENPFVVDGSKPLLMIFASMMYTLFAGVFSLLLGGLAVTLLKFSVERWYWKVLLILVATGLFFGLRYCW